jgi:hypothetical protein
MTTCLVRVTRVTGGTPTVIQYAQGGTLNVNGVIEDSPSAATHTYRIEMKEQGGDGGAGIASASLVIMKVKR